MTVRELSAEKSDEESLRCEIESLLGYEEKAKQFIEAPRQYWEKVERQI